MRIEQEIANQLASGMTPQQLIQSGYNKATVYKVQRELRVKQGQIVAPAWRPEWRTNKLDNRFLPGENMLLDWDFRNLSTVDMYVYTAVVQPEWMRGQWYYSDIRDLLKPGDAKALSWMIPIPSDCALGEWDIRFGLQTQFLEPNPININISNQIQWSEPEIVHLKYQKWGKMFISHSIKDIALVRVLQSYLDAYGLEGIVAEDINEPGRYLPEKFAEQIHQCDFFMALLTSDAIQSEWVQYEVRSALPIHSHPILLKEEGTKLPPDINFYEWILFSRSENVGDLATKITNAAQYISSVAKARLSTKIELPIGTIIAGGVLAFLGALALGAAIKFGSKDKKGQQKE